MAFSLFNLIQFEYPEYLWIALPLIAISIIITFIPFMKLPPEEKKVNGLLRIFIVITRTIIIALLIFALSGPFYTQETVSQGDPTIMLLVDNSTSMNLFSINPEELKAELEQKVPVSKVTIATGENSKLGDAIFRQLQYSNLLLLTDGNNAQDSMNFIDLAAYAEKFNTTINAFELGDEKSDAAITIKGTKSCIVDTDCYFSVMIDNLKQATRVTVTVDGYTIYEAQTTTSTIDLKHTFSDIGYHKIIAELNADDYFTDNNKWYKVVDIVEKPKVLYMNYKPTAFEAILRERYDVTSVASMPSSVSEYFTVTIDDVMHDLSTTDASLLESYTDDGNGLVVWGGMNSFKGPSEIDLLLPIKAGETEQKESVFNFIILVDQSGIVQLSMTETEQAAAALIDILKQRKEEVNIAVVDFSYAGHIIYPLRPASEADAAKQAMNDFQDTTTIEGTLWLRPAALDTGLKIAREMLTGVEGNNNIILVSDGNIHGTKYLPQAVIEISELRKMGVRMHMYDFKNGELDDTVLRQVRMYLSSLGGGMFITSYFSLNSLFEKALIIANYNHYITSDLVINAVISGENKVTVSPSGVSLITTGTGLPIVTVNNYNKVAAISTDDGYEWAEDILEEQNKQMIFRIFDWAIGDPNRKKTTYVEIEDGIVGKETKILYKGNQYPSTSRCSFLPIEDHYECSIIPQQTGFDEMLGVPFGVNYAAEYSNVGYNEAALKSLTEKTNGVIFSSKNINGIAEKVKSDSKVNVLEKIDVDWYILAAVTALFLFEIFGRRVLQNRKNKV
ncbi:MAG: VWA domain-containing protein [Candidatus Woesearchaeota archaeon]|jgi:uncharacterized membrane protein